MALETELKLALHPRDIPALLAHPLLAAPPASARLVSIYYDTPDLKLARQQLAVRLRQQGRRWVQTVKTAEPAHGGLAQRNEWETPARAGQLDFSVLESRPLRQRMKRLQSELVPLFTTRFQRRTWVLTAGASTIEVALDRGSVTSGERRQAICELELELHSGKVDDLFSLARQLQQTVRLHPSPQGKAECGYLLYLGHQPAPVHANTPGLEKTTPVVAAFRQLALACLDHLQRNEAGIGGDASPEYVHQARVAVRRLRSAIRLFAPVLPKAFLQRYQPAWRALAQQLGAVRDWDVFLAETLPAMHEDLAEATVARLQRAAGKHLKAVRKALIATLRAAGYSELLLGFTAEVIALRDDNPQALAELAKHGLQKRSRQVKRALKRLDSLDPAQRHAFRLAVKKLRYAQEFFAGLPAGKDVARRYPRLGAWQGTLGRMNDLAVGEALATRILGELPPAFKAWFAVRTAQLQAAFKR